MCGAAPMVALTGYGVCGVGIVARPAWHSAAPHLNGVRFPKLRTIQGIPPTHQVGVALADLARWERFSGKVAERIDG